MNHQAIGTLVTISYFCVLFGFEYMARRYQFSPELTRRVSHVVSCLAVIGVAWFMTPIVFTLIILTAFCSIAVSRHFSLFTHIHAVSRKTYGEECMPLGFLVTYFIADGSILVFAVAVLILGVADPFAGLVIEHTHSHLLSFGIFFLMTAAILQLSGIPLFWAMPIAISLSLMEKFSPYGSDNLTIPVGAALCLRFLALA